MLKPGVFTGKSKSIISFQIPCLQDLFPSKGHTVELKMMLTANFKKMEKSKPNDSLLYLCDSDLTFQI